MRIKLERLAPEGQAIGRAAGPEGVGRVVFVPYGAPGDEAEVELAATKPGYAFGRLVRVETPGPGRVEPRCPLHFRPGAAGPWCGGCDWQHLDYEHQLRAKRAIVEDCLRRIGRLPQVPVGETLPSPEPWRYRNKVQVPLALQRSGGAARVVAGFYAPESHRVVGFEDCVVQPELSVRVVAKVRALAEEWRWPLYDEKEGSGWLRHLFVRTNSRGRALVALVTRTPAFPKAREFVDALRAAFPEVVSVCQNLQPMKTSVVLGPDWRVLWGQDHLEETVGHLKLRCSPGAFLQVNTGACAGLYDQAKAALEDGAPRPELLVDLYCGVGSIALWLAGSARRVLGIEESRDAIADAWANARLNGTRNARFLGGRAETLLGRLREAVEGLAPGAAAAVVDPPRAGCAPAVLKALTHPSFGRLVYVSCNPATFARDAAGLVRHGWSLASVRPVDLFPQTSHVELVGSFRRA